MITQRNYLITASVRHHPAVYIHFETLGRELEARGHRVLFVLDGDPPAPLKSGPSFEVAVWPAPWPGKRKNFLFALNLIRRFRPACLVANFEAANQLLAAGWLLRVPCRVVWYRFLNACGEMEETAVRPSGWRKRLLYGAATGIVAISEAARNDALRSFYIPAGKCTVFYNSCMDPFAGNFPKVEPPQRPVIFCAGRLERIKGQDILIRAAARLKPEIPGLRLELAGTGSREAEYRQLARGLEVDCEFSGWLPLAEIFNRMARASVTAVPSRSEALSGAAIESLACGVPCVVSAVGGLTEVVRDGKEGLCVPADDPAALAAALKKILLDRAAREAMGRSARQSYLERFAPARVVPPQAEWLERQCGGGR